MVVADPCDYASSSILEVGRALTGWTPLSTSLTRPKGNTHFSGVHVAIHLCMGWGVSRKPSLYELPAASVNDAVPQIWPKPLGSAVPSGKRGVLILRASVDPGEPLGEVIRRAGHQLSRFTMPEASV